MIATLTRLRLTNWKRTPNSLRGVGITVGVILAVAALAIGRGDVGGQAGSGDLLALLFLAWLLGWVMGPIQSGGADFLRPEWFRMLPIQPRRLATGLLAASLTGIGSAITVFVLVSLVIYGGRLGPAAAVVALPAVPLLLILMILASKVVAEALSGAARSRITTEITAVQYGLFVAAMMVGWFAIGVLLDIAGEVGREFSDILPGPAAVAIRVLPTGWGIAAVEAAGRGDWAVAASALLGLAALTWLGLVLWTALLRRRMTATRSGTAIRHREGRRRILPATAVGGVISKDLRTWLRDPRRGVEIRSSLWAAVFSTAALWLLVPDVLPFAGVVVAVIGAMACVNVYAMDGTALWHTLLTPGAERADVRGRQLAWLLIFTPAAVLPSILGIAVSQASWAVPWVAALVPALLGGAAGLIPLLSIYWLVPETDAHKRTGNPAETGGDATALYFGMLFATLLTAAPAAGVLALSVSREQPGLAWVAVPLGAGTGMACAWGCGRLAYRRLQTRGPELLQLMRVGPKPATSAKGADDADDATRALPLAQRALLGLCVTFGMIALFPQAIIPAVMKLTGQVGAEWFIALHTPPTWQWPVIAAMAAIAAVLLAVAYSLYRKAQRLQRDG